MKSSAALICLAAILFILPAPARAELRVNEYLPANTAVLVDEDGDYKDWIEIFNAGPDPVNLTGCGLSDDEDEPLQWTFPSIELAPDRFLLVFASDKDRRDPLAANCWETLIDWGDIWRYRVNETAPPAGWREPGYDDSAWDAGNTGIGNGDGDDATNIPAAVSFCARREFNADDPAEFSRLILHMDYDDAFVAYLNGVEIGRANIGTPGLPPAWDQHADSSIEAFIFRGLDPPAFPVLDFAGLLMPGVNVLAVEIHNWDTYGDLSMIPFLSRGLHEIPAEPGNISETLAGLLPHLHANFKLKSDGGEELILSDPGGELLDGVNTIELPSNISLGRQPDGSVNWLYFDEPSPAAPNLAEGGSAVADPPFVIPDGGFHSGPVIVSLLHSDPAALIHFTLDGAEPTESSPLYLAPFSLDTTAVVRAKAWVPGQVPGLIATRGFMVDESTSLPVIFVTTDPPNLWDWETGIYVFGPNAEPEYPYFGANFWQAWEKPVHVDFYEADGATGFRLDGGVRIHGDWSRAHPQKSFRIYARDSYGQDEIVYPVFPHKENDRFHNLILRNVGQDWDWAAMRDPMAHLLASEQDIEWSDSRPARVYLNGVYWGFLYFRERQDKHYLESNCGADSDNIDYLENSAEVIEGDTDHYFAMRDFIEDNDMNDGFYYAQLPEWMDVLNHATYTTMETYLANIDWPANNRRYWRPREADGIWRWVFADLDLIMARYYNPPDHPTIYYITDDDGIWPYDPWSTMVLRELLESEDYTNTFINCMTEHLNYTFAPARLHSYIDSFVELLTDEMPRHRERWGHSSANHWLSFHVGLIRSFTNERPFYILRDFMDYFGLPDTLRLGLDIDPPDSGWIDLTAISIDSTWTATYFQGVPISLNAVSAPDWVFTGWSDPTLPAEPSVIVEPVEDYAVTAKFAPRTYVVINEINYNSSDIFNPGDWVELWNRGYSPADLSGFVFKDGDDGHSFVIPEGTVLAAEGFLVLCEHLEAFQALFPEADCAIGNLGFGFSGGGERLRLFDPGNELLDTVAYDDTPPWPTEPDGDGPTLELIDPAEDNDDPANWAASEEHGTPCAINSAYNGTGVAAAGLPAALLLQRPWPNPFNPTVTLRLGLHETGLLSFSIYDIRGREVARLWRGRRESGWHDFVWRAEGVAAGVYLARAQSGKMLVTEKLILLK